MRNGPRIDALSRFLFGGENFALRSPSELKQALVTDGICLALLLLGLAGAVFGRPQDPPKDQKPAPQQSSSSNSAQPASAQTQQEDSVAEAARKAQAKKAKPGKKVYGEEDLAGMRGGVSVVGDGNTAAARTGDSTANAPSAERAADNAEYNERQWRQRAQQIHAQIDATDAQIKNLRDDIKRNGATGFDPQTGLKDNIIYINDKNARLQKLENKKKVLEQALDQLQEEGRKAGIPPEWVR